jgi:hypothetical protein
VRGIYKDSVILEKVCNVHPNLKISEETIEKKSWDKRGYIERIEFASKKLERERRKTGSAASPARMRITSRDVTLLPSSSQWRRNLY